MQKQTKQTNTLLSGQIQQTSNSHSNPGKQTMYNKSSSDIQHMIIQHF